MARKDTTFTATFHGAERAGTSTMGNPTWRLSTSEGFYLTQTNGSIGYSIGNYTGGPDSLIGRDVTFTVTPAGRVKNMVPVDATV